jgi:hypothetical protein
MLDPEKLIVGKAYFVQGYFDREGRIPLIDTYIYIGKNLFAEKKSLQSDEWFFQDPESFLKNGSFTTMSKEKKAKIKPDIYCVNKKALFSFYDIYGLIEKLSKLKDKYKEE